LQIPEVYRGIPITKLYAGQFLEFYAYAVLGVGQDHSKWNPVSGVSFSSRKIATIARPGKAKQLWDLELTIGKSDFKNKKLEDVQKVETLIRDMHHVGDGTARIEDFADAITITDVPSEYLFSFDTDGSMTARKAFEMGCKALSARFSNLSEQLAEDL
jgi:DNA-directed RNA polymerase alpha subunit